MPRTACMIRQWVAVAGLLVAAGCATTAPPAGTSEDVILEAPEAQVRAAFVRVLTEGGYDVTQGAQDDSEIRTGYREEISNYNWLYRTQFGVNRSRVIVTLTPESETATRVTVRMMYEGKDGEWMPLAGSWVPYDAALPQNASNTIRLVKNELGLL
ncbi:MAG: hypothetical protein A3H49_01250 [Nitrospirae bacterium RIFCSPLOWO2_02_FULL_62_14]|nr:MAG: hypothetical protein A3H49_01250 [Nitrospirae bacterium RIFCSPLOWO2_02_FULL_62_14]